MIPAHTDSLDTLLAILNRESSAVRSYTKRLAHLRHIYGPWAPARTDYREYHANMLGAIGRYYTTLRIVRTIEQPNP